MVGGFPIKIITLFLQPSKITNSSSLPLKRYIFLKKKPKSKHNLLRQGPIILVSFIFHWMTVVSPPRASLATFLVFQCKKRGVALFKEEQEKLVPRFASILFTEWTDCAFHWACSRHNFPIRMNGVFLYTRIPKYIDVHNEFWIEGLFLLVYTTMNSCAFLETHNSEVNWQRCLQETFFFLH